MTIKIDVGLDSKKFKKGSAEVQAEAAKIESALGSIALAASAAFAGFAAGIGTAVNAASKVEDLTTRFEVLTGSVSVAQKTLKDLQDFSSRTPFQLEGIADAGAQLLSFGVSADDLVPRLQRIGDVAAASGSDLGEISLIFGQVAAAGKLTGERLLQLQERAIPIGPALAKSLGVAESSVRDLVSKGKVDFETFEKAFDSLSDKGGAAFGGIEKQSKTLSGVISTLKDNFFLLAADIGKEFLPVAKTLAESLTGIFQFIRDNPAIKTLARDFLIAGSVLTGIIASVTAGALAFRKLSAALEIANIALKLVGLSVKSLVGATGIGLLVIIIAEVALNWEKIWPRAQLVFENFSKNTLKILGNLAGAFSSLIRFDISGVKKNVSQLTDILTKGFSELPDTSKDLAEKTTPDPDIVAARLLAAEQKKEEARQREIQGILEQEGLRKELAEQFFQEGLDKQAELQEILNQIKTEQNEAELQRLKTQLKLETQARLETLNEQRKNEQAAQVRFIKDRIEFGQTIAVINDTINNTRVQSFKKASGDLVQLQQSENATLKAIGKAAAVAQITIQTAEAAVNIYSNFQRAIPFPPVSIPLGIAGAAAAIAFGAEQIGKVTSAQTGGIVPQLNPGLGDRQPALLEAGELIVPRQNFDEVINAVASNRGGIGANQVAPEPVSQSVLIGFDGQEAANVLTIRQNEQRALGTSEEIA